MLAQGEYRNYMPPGQAAAPPYGYSGQPYPGQSYQPYPSQPYYPPPAARPPPMRQPPPSRRPDTYQAPRRRPVDLRKADTSQTVHQLYVKVAGSGEALAPNALKSRNLTLQILQFINQQLPVFGQMGIGVRVNKIRDIDLQNSKLIGAMKRKGITRLPALITPTNVYVGNREIVDVYTRNIRGFQAHKQREEKEVKGMAPEDDLDRYYASELGSEQAWQDAVTGSAEDGEGIGDSADMMDAYRAMMSRREKSNRQRQPGGSRLAAIADTARRGGGAATVPTAVTGGSRRDNVQADDPQGSIDQLISNIDANTYSQAFAGGGGDSLMDDGGPGNSQDDLMFSAYWANQEETLS